jgi:hypothetical protein
LLNEGADLHIVSRHEALGWGREVAVERLSHPMLKPARAL